jgi:hypothetical protein
VYTEDGEGIVAVDFVLRGETALLLESSWRWEAPDGTVTDTEIPISKRSRIIQRIKEGLEFLGNEVETDEFEETSGLREPSQVLDTEEVPTVELLADGKTLRLIDSGKTMTIPVEFVGADRADIQLEALRHWDPPNDIFEVDLPYTGYLMQLVTEFVAKRGCTLMMHK